MADQSDVEAALVELVSSALYPGGPAAGSAVGPICRVYRGWPSSAALDEDLAAGTVNVSVFPLAGQQRNTTRFPDVWTVRPNHERLQVKVTDDSVTFSGCADAGQVAGLLLDQTTYRYVTKAGDTPRRVALGLIGQLGPKRLALLLDETIRFYNVGRLVARVVGPAVATREVRRQQQAFRLSFWCPTPAVRDHVVALADLSLAAQSFIDLPDGSSARLRYVRSETIDRASDATLFRRDLIYDVEYATMLQEVQAAMLFGDLRLNDGSDLLA